MKFFTVSVFLLFAGASGYQQPSRSSLRSLGQKTVSASGPNRNARATMTMEGKFVLRTRIVAVFFFCQVENAIVDANFLTL